MTARIAPISSSSIWSLRLTSCRRRRVVRRALQAKGGETTVAKFFTFIDALLKREEGQTMAEYGVVLAVITLAVIAAITLLSENVRDAILNVANILP